MCASVGSGSRVAKVTIPTVEIIGLSEEVPVNVQPPVPDPNGVTTLSTVPPDPPLPPPPVPPLPARPLEPQPSPRRQQSSPPDQGHRTFVHGSVSPSSKSPSLETRSTSAVSGPTETRAYPESGQ